MLRITADVNGEVIGYIFIHNTGRRREDNVWEYNAATWTVKEQEGTIGAEGILHYRHKGWAELVKQVLLAKGVK